VPIFANCVGAFAPMISGPAELGALRCPRRRGHHIESSMRVQDGLVTYALCQSMGGGARSCGAQRALPFAEQMMGSNGATRTCMCVCV